MRIKKSFLQYIWIFPLIFLSFHHSISADIQEDTTNVSFEFVSPIDKEIVEIEDCEVTKHIENALHLEYSTTHSENIILQHYVGEVDQFYFRTFKWIDSNVNYLILGPVTTKTYAWKVTPVQKTDSPFRDNMPDLSEGWYMTFDVVCKNEIEEEDIVEEQEDTPEDIEPTIEIPDTPIEKENEIIETEKPNILQEIVTKVKSIVSDIRDVFTWNIQFEDIDWQTLLPKEEDIDMVEEKEITEEETKPFAFPFKSIIGVTQWYGNTAFQKPHTGIDFGATKEQIISPGDGEVVALGWDSFNGECFSGGNYLVIKHTNGMHTAYFHIEKYFVKLGDTIKKGELLAISGNSGRWNCQNLSYHLHFETREGRYQDTHVNPVDYIDIDWDTVPTLGYQYNPGRLSGENPHPTY